jgi:hypothetical protein
MQMHGRWHWEVAGAVRLWGYDAEDGWGHLADAQAFHDTAMPIPLSPVN